MLQTHQSSRNTGLPDYGTCEKVLADEKSEAAAPNADHLLARKSLLCKDDCVEDISSDVPSCQAKVVVCVHGFRKRYHSDLLSLSRTVIS